jgi:competence protein ComQ
LRGEVLEEMYSIVDKYFLTTDLNAILKQFIAEKAEENTNWSDITANTHWMLGGDSHQIDRFSALTEWVVLAFDIIDDLQDEDNTSKPWMVCPREYALNAVLSFLIAFIGELGELRTNNPQVSSSLMMQISQMLASSIIGQQIDLNLSVQTDADYIRMVEQKSGSLLRFACFMGYSLIPDLSNEIAAQMDELANYIGVIAQLNNDLSDVLRYDVKGDLLQKKRTLPILFLLQDSPEEFPPLAQYYLGEISEPEFVLRRQDCIQYIEDSGCIEYSKIVQSLFIEKAEELFVSISGVSPWKEKFKEITFSTG